MLNLNLNEKSLHSFTNVTYLLLEHLIKVGRSTESLSNPHIFEHISRRMDSGLTWYASSVSSNPTNKSEMSARALGSTALPNYDPTSNMSECVWGKVNCCFLEVLRESSDLWLCFNANKWFLTELINLYREEKAFITNEERQTYSDQSLKTNPLLFNSLYDDKKVCLSVRLLFCE